jgi:hypothetical protein
VVSSRKFQIRTGAAPVAGTLLAGLLAEFFLLSAGERAITAFVILVATIAESMLLRVTGNLHSPVVVKPATAQRTYELPPAFDRMRANTIMAGINASPRGDGKEHDRPRCEPHYRAESGRAACPVHGDGQAQDRHEAEGGSDAHRPARPVEC